MFQINFRQTFLLLGMLALVASCDTLELPEAGSIPDETPPSAGFSASPSESDFLQYNFSNESISATDFAWDFGDGTTSTDRDPVHVYEEVGTYTVMLTASDKLNASDQTTREIVVEEPMSAFVPEILNPGFDVEGDDSFRDNWRNGDLGGVIQITSSPVYEGEKAAKLPSAGDRIGYQLISVEPDTDYSIRFFYTLKTDPVGSITVSVLAGEVNNPDGIADATIASFTGEDQSSASTFTQGTLEFNSGSNSTIAIYFTNTAVEARIDSFTIEVL